MTTLDNGGMLGKKMDLTAYDSYLITSTGTGISFVGKANGIIAGTTGTTTVGLTTLTGGSDSRPLANDIVIVSYTIGGQQNTVDPAAYGSTFSNTSDASAAATIVLKPNTSVGSSNTLTLVGNTTATIDGSAATTTTVILPGPPAANDIVIVTYGIGSATNRTGQFSISGYTTLHSVTSPDTYDANMGVFYKKMGATPDTNVSIPATGNTTDSGAVAIQVWRNQDLTNPIEASASSSTSGGRRPSPPVIRPATNNSVIIICGEGSHNQPTELFTAPSGYSTNFQSVTGSSNTNMTSVGMGYRTTPYEIQNELQGNLYNPTTPGSYTNITKLFAVGTIYAIGYNSSYRIMTSTPNTDIVLPATGSTSWASTYQIQVWRYVDTTTPLDVTVQTSVAANGSSTPTANSVSTTGTRRPDPPSITPTTTGAIIIAAGGAASAAVTGAAYTNTDLGNFITDYSDDTIDAIGGMYSAIWTSGAYDPAAFTTAGDVTTGAAAATTIALRPGTITTTTTGNKVYSGSWNNSAKYLTKAVEPEVARIVSYTTAYTTGTTSFSINIVAPQQIRPNDLILITAGNGNATDTAQFDNITYKPTGFTLIKEVGNSTSDTHCAAFYKVADGSESGTTINVPAQSADVMCATCFVIRGALTSNPIGNQGANTNVDLVTSAGLPGIVTTSNHSIVFALASTDGGDTGPFNLTSNSSSWLNRNSVQLAANYGAGSSLLTAWKTVNSSGGSSESVTVDYQISDGISGYQFEVKSVY